MPFYAPLRKESVDFSRTSINFCTSVPVNVAISALLCAWPIFPLLSQTADTKPATSYDYDHPERRVVTYLDVDHAIRNINSQKAQVMQDIVRLNKIIVNFNGKIQGADADYKKIKDSYQKGIDLYYRREYIDSSYALKDTRKMTLELYKKFSDHFQVQVGELLNSCSESMVNHELKNLPGENKDQISIDDLKQNQYRLRIAYNQIYLANQMTRDNRYDAAIDHFRLAKLYAINVLKNLETDASKKAAMDKQYEADIIDAMGGVMSNAPSANPS